ncbi:MAG TPA: 5'/3'-nucleotidase SurE [Myxococcota bacterium]|nr:5'/3'-nucleotidase SurE [Myxococcota bacterium]HOA13490.1 5'/3'-nucleotidase SurE [Myxococcota bacterium]HOH76839.1 5'/3'-nucleotidase SurE [Myxococcota bacterium]HPV04236.1 5'/3'-nucleotidase SurE [Myxococcota bacterium]
MSKPLILVTNDDGILSTGLDPLIRAAEAHGEVWVVAPDSEKSGVSHAITLTEPLRYTQVGQRRFALNGTPVDCVFIGLNHILPRRPDFVFSGVNRGPNLGFDVLYSGTVGAAMEGTIQKVPSAAFSMVSRGSFDFNEIGAAVDSMVARIVLNGVPDGVTLNVNIPDRTIGEFKGFKVTRLGNRQYSNEVLTREDPRGGKYLWVGGTRVTNELSPDSDTGAVAEGWGSISPVSPDLMAHHAVKHLAWANVPDDQE